MIGSKVRPTPNILPLDVMLRSGLFGLVGLGVGLALAALPLLWAGIALAVAVLATLTLIEPLVGIGVVLLFATFKPLTDYFVPELPLDIGQIALIVTLGAWLLRRAIRRDIRIPASPLNLPLLIFIGIGGLSLIPALSIGYGIKELIKWLQILAMMWLVQLEAGARRWPLVVGMTLAAALVEALIGIWQFGLRGEGPKTFLILGDRFYRAYGTFEQPNPFGGFIGLTLPIAIALALYSLTTWLSRWRKDDQNKTREDQQRPHGGTATYVQVVLSGMLALTLAAALVMSWSRGAWLGFGAAALVLAAAWPRRRIVSFTLIGAVIALTVVGLNAHLLPASIATRLTDFTSEVTTNFDVRGVDITTENYAVIERLAHWQTAEEMARYHLLLGVGLGNYEPVYPGYALINWPIPLGHAHNIYLNMLAETGIIGFLAYIGLWCAVFAVTWRVTRSADGWRRAIAIGLLGAWTHLTVHHLVDNLYVANIHLHIGALLGVLAILYEQEKNQFLGQKH